jgi:anti-sigma regulatory factor (Ser/Thr protein kinase)
VPTVELEFPAKSVYVGVARLAVAGMARASEMDEDTVFDVKTAVSEALSTAVLYTDEEGDTQMALSWDDREDSVVIEVSHPGGLHRPDETDSMGAEQQELSLALLRSLVDGCEFTSEEDGATIIRLTINR